LFVVSVRRSGRSKIFAAARATPCPSHGGVPAGIEKWPAGPAAALPDLENEMPDPADGLPGLAESWRERTNYLPELKNRLPELPAAVPGSENGVPDSPVGRWESTFCLPVLKMGCRITQNACRIWKQVCGEGKFTCRARKKGCRKPVVSGQKAAARGVWKNAGIF